MTLATAESCTGGLIGHRVTSVSGSSTYYVGGIIAYSNAVKVRELGVEAAVLGREGAVSERVALQMATGVRERLKADVGISVTGVAGPTGGTVEKPVGLVYIGLAYPDGASVRRFVFAGDRRTITAAVSEAALGMVKEYLLETGENHGSQEE